MPDTQQQRQPSGSISLPVQPQQNRINWGAICRKPIVDSFISEPCETLTSPDGFALTSKGQRVLLCLGVGGAAAYLALEVLASIKSLGPAVGCGAGTGAYAFKKGDRLFADIYGFDDIKKLFRIALESDHNCSILLIGPPASAKTLFLQSLMRLKDSYFIDCINATKSGIVDYLFENKPTYGWWSGTYKGGHT